jgi:hypothetical protein
MSNTPFKATLEMFIPLTIEEIVKNRNIDEQSVFELTKLWHLSQLTLKFIIEDIKKGA